VAIHEELLRWEFLRAQGPGGQHVNKSATRVRLSIPLGALEFRDPATLERIRSRLAHRIDASGALVVSCQDSRSQFRNRQQCLLLASAVLAAALVVSKKRKPTRATRGSQERRIKTKQRRGAVKRSRRAEESE
jgi:ribosome-associated protein